MFRLPVSGLQVAIRQPSGEDDLFLQESRASITEVALGLLSRLAQPADGSTVQWSELAITDIEALLLLIRRSVMGDHIETDVVCTQPDCGARITISFGIGEYLSYHHARLPKGLVSDSGWLRFPDQPIKFRLPTGADLLAVIDGRRPDRELIRRCLDPADSPAAQRRRAIAAMSTIAPNLSGAVCGQCVQCAQGVNVYFDVQQYVVQELRNHCNSVYPDIHLLAFHYRWSEESILSLPRARRSMYAQMLRDQGIQG
jgi:hypothetical protein